MGSKDPRVEAYIAKSADFAKPILKHLRKIVHAGCPKVEETIEWQFLHFDYKGVMCGMAAFKQHCAFGFWKEALILDRDKAAEKTAMGSFGCITSLADLPSEKTLIQYVKKAAALNEAGIKEPGRTQPKKKEPLSVPDYFSAALKKNARRRETNEWPLRSDGSRKAKHEIGNICRPRNSTRLLAQGVHFDQRNASCVVSASNYRGIIAGNKRDQDGRIAIIVRRKGGLLNLLLLCVAPIIIKSHQRSTRVAQIESRIGQRARNTNSCQIWTYRANDHSLACIASYNKSANQEIVACAHMATRRNVHQSPGPWSVHRIQRVTWVQIGVGSTYQSPSTECPSVLPS
jgi:hypothetical protein